MRITIEKHIPVAAGLGGGSADAAAVLRLAAAASGLRPAGAELADLAMSLGADVPSQLDPRPALVTGAGEGVEPLAARSLARRAARRARRAQHAAGLRARRRARARRASRSTASTPTRSTTTSRPRRSTSSPRRGRALALLADGRRAAALVTGSGPAAFGLFEEPDAVARDLAERWRGLTAAFESAPAGYADVRSAS